jgi:hypothetical protein
MCKENAVRRSDEYVVPVDIGCKPSPSGGGEIVIQNEEGPVFLIFNAVSSQVSERGLLERLGVAVVECMGCALTKFGYPNDEGTNEHALWDKGLSECTGVCEVMNSSWKAALEQQMDTSARRIWGDQYHRAYEVPEGGERQWDWRHYIVLFKENTFECVADSLKLTSMHKTFREALADVYQRILEDPA